MGKIMRHLISFPFLLPLCSTFPLSSPSWQYLLKTVSTEGNLKKTSIVLEDELVPAGLWICKYHSFLTIHIHAFASLRGQQEKAGLIH